MADRLQFPMLNHDEGTLEQLAQRLAAHAIAYEVNRLEDDERASGWERLQRDRALLVAQHMRAEAARLFELGARGLEERVAFERARMQGFPCATCGHRHEGSRYQFRCFQCLCAERPNRDR